MSHQLVSLRSVLVVLGFAFISAGCASDDESDTDTEPETPSELEIAGSWTGEFGDEEISSDTWNNQSVISFDNDENSAVTQNADDDAFNPSLFSKLVWTEPENDTFYYCTVDFGVETAELAAATTKTADEADLEGSGCGGFPWTKLTRAEP